MSLPPSKMTRRKQNAPKRLKSTDKTGSNLTSQQSSSSSNVTSDSGTGDGEADEGDTASDEESTADQQGDAALGDRDTASSGLTSQADNEAPGSESADSLTNERTHFLDKKGSRKCCHKEKADECQCSSEANHSGTLCSRDIATASLSRLEETAFPWSSKCTGVNSSPGSLKYKYSSKLSPPIIPSSPALAYTGLDPQMALVMSSMPLGMLSRMRTSPSTQESALNYVSVPTPALQDEQPLDLSKKTDRTVPLSSLKDKTAESKNCSPTECALTSSSSITNGFSSLQSLQQRFGGHYPLGLSQKSSAVVIPLQSSVMHKTAVAPHTLPMPADGNLRPLAGKSKSGSRCGDWLEKQDGTNPLAVSPIPRAGNSRHTSPLLAEEPGSDLGGKHTIHRCSCQKSFSTLYALSLHLQETGHTPGPSKSASLMDYPKLVRGQDMWLNQESEQTRRILRCMQCGESFKSLPLLTVHMMQTQHYTKIVSSDHGRRSHKCSTYCDRELDKECIFKCKVCHEAFTDMEGLANHMIVSGHHKKQSSRQTPNPADFSGDLSPLARQGRRKRFLPDDVISAAASGTASSIAAAGSEYTDKQSVRGHSGLNGFHCESKSSSHRSSNEVQSLKLLQCDSCGRNVESREFDSHVRACLKHRAEVIDALKSKLAVEEALLSKSESKLLRSGFRLSSVSGHREYMFMAAGSREKDSLLNEEENYENSSEDNCTKPSQVKCERVSPVRNHSSAVAEPRPMPKISAKICHLIEVPLRKWYCSSDEPKHAVASKDKDNSDAATVSEPSIADMTYNARQLIKKEDIDQDLPPEGKPAPSSGVGEKRKHSQVDSANDGFSSARRKDMSSSDFVQESSEESFDFTSSALHKLDMFSRGLKFSPPRRNSSPEPKLAPHHSARAFKKKELASSKVKSPPVSASPVSHQKADSPEPPKKNMTFDIIDPNADSGDTESSSSALEAMESFIHKSFSAKSDLRTSNLASMFSPFRNCFPLPGTLPGQSGGVLADTSDQTLSHFAKFSKFFRMVPGVPPFPEATSVHSLEIKKTEGAQPNLAPSSSLPLSESHLKASHDKTVFLSKKSIVRAPSSSSTIKVPIVKFPPDNLREDSSCSSDRLSGDNNSDVIPSSKKYKYCTTRTVDALISPARNQRQHQDLSQFSGKQHVQNNGSDSSRGESLLLSASTREASSEEPQRKRKCELMLDPDKASLRLRSMENGDDNKDRWSQVKACRIKSEIGASPDEGNRCHESDKSSGFSSQERRIRSSSLVESPQPCQQQVRSKSVADIPSNGQTGADREHHEQGQPFLADQPSIQRQEDLSTSQPVLDHSCRDRDSKSDAGGSLHGSKGLYNSIGRSDNEMNILAQGKGSPIQAASNADQLVSFINTGCFERPGKEPGEINSHYSDDDDDDECGGGHCDTSEDNGDDFHEPVTLVKHKDRIKVNSDKADPAKTHSVSDMTRASIHTMCDQQLLSTFAVKVEDGDNNGDSQDNSHSSEDFVDRGNSFKLSPSNQLNVEDDAAAEGEHDKDNMLVSGHQKVLDPDSCVKDRKNVNTKSKCRSTEHKLMYKLEEVLHTMKASSFDNTDGDTNRVEPSDLLEDNAIVSQHATKNIEDVDTQEKKSALDSLSSFVYSQPLTSEHPLDSLHRLLSTNDLAHLTADPHKYSAATSNKCLTPDIPVPLNLTSKGGGVVSSGGCSSDDNDDGDLAAAEGAASEGDLREYKCAACNRKFASKGSYRYHLSRCHLSSVKKYGIKEAFNMSPYVYLPLDHTAKFSKYYQLAHELANKGK